MTSLIDEINMDNIAIKSAWNLYNKELKKFIQTKINDTAAGEDILQEVFSKLYSHSSSVNADRLRPWLYQVTRNMVNDYYRKSKASIKTELRDLPEKPAAINMNEPFAKCLSSFIHKLPAKYKEAITLVEINKMDQVKLSQHLGISYSGAKSRVQRAKELLKGLFLQCCNVTTDRYGNIVGHKTKSACNTCPV
jgi:RNA polymerase sigma-70 factor, ECF subfamily